MPIYNFQKIANIASYKMLYKVKECWTILLPHNRKEKYKNLYLCKKDLNIWTIVAKKMEIKYDLPHTKANDINFQKFANITS